VTWSIQLYDHQNHDYQLLRQTYRITLEKVDGDWKIRNSQVEDNPRA